MNPSDLKLAEEMVEIIQWLSSLGESPATGGNYSFRSVENPDKVYISRSGIDKSEFNLDDFVQVDLAGKISDRDEQRGFKASAETFLHTMIYKNFDAGCVLHGHGIEVVLYSLKNSQHGRIEGLELLKALEGITTHDTAVTVPIYDNDQDLLGLSDRISKEITGFQDVFTFLLRGHGITVWGKDISTTKRHYEAYRYLIELENRRRS